MRCGVPSRARQKLVRRVSRRRYGCAVFVLLAGLALAGPPTPSLDLPASEAPSSWADALDAAGLSRGAGGVVVEVRGEVWALTFAAGGGVRTATVAAPHTEAERERVAIVAASLLRSGPTVRTVAILESAGGAGASGAPAAAATASGSSGAAPAQAGSPVGSGTAAVGGSAPAPSRTASNPALKSAPGAASGAKLPSPASKAAPAASTVAATTAAPVGPTGSATGSAPTASKAAPVGPAGSATGSTPTASTAAPAAPSFSSANPPPAAAASAPAAGAPASTVASPPASTPAAASTVASPPAPTAPRVTPPAARAAASTPSGKVPVTLSGALAGTAVYRPDLAVNAGGEASVRVGLGTTWLALAVNTFEPTIFTGVTGSLGLASGAVHLGGRWAPADGWAVRGGGGVVAERWAIVDVLGEREAWGVGVEAELGVERRLFPGLAVDLGVVGTQDLQDLTIDAAATQPSALSTRASLGLRFGQ